MYYRKVLPGPGVFMNSPRPRTTTRLKKISIELSPENLDIRYSTILLGQPKAKNLFTYKYFYDLFPGKMDDLEVFKSK